MSNEEKSRGLYWAIGAVVLAPVLYVLSIGPVGLFCEQMGIDREPVRPMYAPVVWLYENTPLREPLDWYVRLWSG